MRYWKAFVNIVRVKTKPFHRLFFIILTFIFIQNSFGEEKGKLVEKIAAIVNGQVILLSEVEETQTQVAMEMKRQKKLDSLEPPQDLKKRVLDQMINDRLISQEIEKNGLSANDSTIDNAIATVMQQNRLKSIEELKKLVQQEGMTFEEYRQSLKKQIENAHLMNRLIRPRIQLSEQDIDSAVSRRVATVPSNFRIETRMIFKKKPQATKESLNRLLKEIEVGIPFERIANRETEGPGKVDGGSIGVVSPSDLQPELGKAMEKLREGQVSEVIETSQGF